MGIVGWYILAQIKGDNFKWWEGKGEYYKTPVWQVLIWVWVIELDWQNVGSRLHILVQGYKYWFKIQTIGLFLGYKFWFKVKLKT